MSFLPQDNNLDYNNLDFMIPKKSGLEQRINAVDGIYNAYVSPSSRYGKNILKETINWRGREINEKLFVYCSKDLEHDLDAVSGITKRAADEYEKAYGHELEKEVRIYVYNSYRYGQTNLAYVGVPTGVGGLIDVVSSPIYSTGVGLVLYGSNHGNQPRIIAGGGGKRLFYRVFSRMKEWFNEFW